MRGDHIGLAILIGVVAGFIFGVLILEILNPHIRLEMVDGEVLEAKNM